MTKLATATVDSDPRPYTTHVRVGHHVLVADEPASGGGSDAGPAPYGLLLSSLGACTAMTLLMYAERKGWDIAPVHVELAMTRVDDAERIDRRITVGPSVTPEQRARLAEIAEKTPVTKTLKRAATIDTTFP